MAYHGIIFSLRSHPFARGTGAHRIATVLRQEGWDCEVVDFARSWTLDELKELVRSRVSSKTIFIGFSTFFNFWQPKFDTLVDWIKLTYPNIKTIIGGQSVAWTQAKHVDYWVDSYGEVAIIELLKHLTGNGTAPLKFDFEHFGQKKLIKAIQAYPAYPLKSYGSRLEKRDFLQPYEWLTTEFSRGCKFSCAFCNFPILGVKEDHSRTQEDFESEMKYNYDEWGITDYYVADETFNDSVEKITKFADVAEKLNFKPFFTAGLRADLLFTHKNSWPELARLGVGGQFYGIESFHHDSAKLIGKGMKTEKVKEGLLEYKEYMKSKMFYRADISLVIGLPYETAETLQDAFDWLMANWTDQTVLSYPLDIGSDSDDYMNNSTNQSKMTKNLAKYGLRTPEPPHDFNLDDIAMWHYTVPGVQGMMKYWEHDTMNTIQAVEFCEKLKTMSFEHFKVCCWQLAALSFGHQQHIQDIPGVADIGRGLERPDEDHLQSFLRNYITNKLNWTPN